MKATITPKALAVMIAAGIDPETIADMMLGVAGKRVPKALGARKPREPEPPADYAPTWHVMPSETAGNLDCYTGHKPGAAMLELVRTATRKHGVRYARFTSSYYGQADQVIACSQELAAAGVAVVGHETRDAGLAAAAAEPPAEPSVANGTPAHGTDAAAHVRRLNGMLAPRPIGATSSTPVSADRPAPRRG